MTDMQQMFQRYRKYIFYLLAIYVIGWGFTEYQSIFLGLILGTCITLYNLWILVRKHNQFDRALRENRKPGSLGTTSRMAAAGVAIFFALRYPEYFNLISIIIGLMTMYIVIMIDYVIEHSRA
ncbi:MULTISPECIES: ATP synthase subunit I [Metabacillus]|jgi:ATP synthase protein I|uniref:ATP synthase subunit I n=1 Tax=Metabacillus rhizolycopersici TaxID=2875709 RepID=A0ABS7ULC8_9BACI|nr:MULTISPECIES: ATP synthase subunit I [Metabacillus]MBZ5749122.1 ATP synthase subunit I [Metabacillus rhizolycopersici]MCM3653007.1 ATP synthase subunit I [Metabacillus litoralis]